MNQENRITLESFLNGLTFKTEFMGARKADVQACLEDVLAIHHDEMVDAQEDFAAERDSLNAALENIKTDITSAVAAKEAAEKSVEDAVRARDDAVRARDEAVRTAEDANRRAEDATRETERLRIQLEGQQNTNLRKDEENRGLTAQIETLRRTISQMGTSGSSVAAPVASAAPVYVSGGESEAAVQAARELADHYRISLTDMKKYYQEERDAHWKAEATIRELAITIADGGSSHYENTAAPTPSVNIPMFEDVAEEKAAPNTAAKSISSAAVMSEPVRAKEEPQPAERVTRARTISASDFVNWRRTQRNTDTGRRTGDRGMKNA